MFVCHRTLRFHDAIRFSTIQFCFSLLESRFIPKETRIHLYSFQRHVFWTCVVKVIVCNTNKNTKNRSAQRPQKRPMAIRRAVRGTSRWKNRPVQKTISAAARTKTTLARETRGINWTKSKKTGCILCRTFRK